MGKKIGILTHPLEVNYGGLFQAYALQNVLRQMGHDVVTIDRHNTHNYSSMYRHILGFCKRWIHNRILNRNISPLWNTTLTDKEYNTIARHMIDFVEKNIRTTRRITSSELDKIDKEYEFDAYVVGSDQVWMYGYCPNSFLDFVIRDNVVRIFYAASCGQVNFTKSLYVATECRQLVKKFQAVSVREKWLCDFSLKELGREAQFVLDPTLLLTPQDYISLINPENRESSPIVFSYILDDFSQKQCLLQSVSKSIDLPIVNGNIEKYYVKDWFSNPENYVYPSPEDWLWNMSRAQFVVTDSFHGMAMSIVFNKPFVVILNNARGSQRFLSLLDLLGLQSRIITNESELHQIMNEPIDYTKVNSILYEMREQSLNFLSSNLSV